MSISAVLLDGARRAATYATMLFSLNSQPPASAQPPPAQPAAPALAVDSSVAACGLTLVAHHLDVLIAGGTASVLARMLLRNDRPTEVSVQYVQPQPARALRGDGAGLLGAGDVAQLCDDADLSPQAAERAEAAPGWLVHRYDVIVFAPGDPVRDRHDGGEKLDGCYRRCAYRRSMCRIAWSMYRRGNFTGIIRG